MLREARVFQCETAILQTNNICYRVPTATPRNSGGAGTASRSHDARTLAHALTKLILHEGRILTAYLAESLFVHVMFSLHAPPLVELLCRRFDQPPGALHHLVKQDVKLLVIREAPGVLK